MAPVEGRCDPRSRAGAERGTQAHSSRNVVRSSHVADSLEHAEYVESLRQRVAGADRRSARVGDDRLRAELREKGIAQAKKFTWRDAAEKTLRLYQEAYAI